MCNSYTGIAKTRYEHALSHSCSSEGCCVDFQIDFRQFHAMHCRFVQDWTFVQSTSCLTILCRHKKKLLRKFITWPTPAIMDRYAQEFQDLHQIPYVVGAVDGSHIPIVAPRLHAADYYNRKGFHSILLQGVVSAKCLFWEIDIG